MAITALGGATASSSVSLGVDRRQGTVPARAKAADSGESLAQARAQKAGNEKRRADQSNARSLEVARVLSELRSRDLHVRSHEAAHMAAGGSYIRGGAAYSYEKGPDGREYAIGGEVGIDLSPLPGKPEETAAKMRTVRAAALAPSDPSAADMAIAAAAAAMELSALAEIAADRAEEASKSYARAGEAVGPAPPGSSVDLVA